MEGSRAQRGRELGAKICVSIKSMGEIVRVDGDLTAGFLNY